VRAASAISITLGAQYMVAVAAGAEPIPEMRRIWTTGKALQMLVNLIDHKSVLLHHRLRQCLETHLGGNGIDRNCRSVTQIFLNDSDT
jgi:hypothetical protein